jgi:hypothetical protein
METTVGAMTSISSTVSLKKPEAGQPEGRFISTQSFESSGQSYVQHTVQLIVSRPDTRVRTTAVAMPALFHPSLPVLDRRTVHHKSGLHIGFHNLDA